MHKSLNVIRAGFGHTSDAIIQAGTVDNHIIKNAIGITRYNEVEEFLWTNFNKTIETIDDSVFNTIRYAILSVNVY